MQFQERVDIHDLNYLNSFSIEQYSSYCSLKDNGEKVKKNDIKGNYNLFKEMIKYMILAGGKIDRFYKQKDNLRGRYISSQSLQSSMKSVRGFLMKNRATDIDMVNCHPTIFYWLCRKHNIECPNLKYYITDRDVIIENNPVVNIKQGVIDIIYGSNERFNSKFLKDFKTECLTIQDILLKKEEYKWCYDDVSDVDTNHNIQGKAASRILLDYECIIIKKVIRYFTENNIEVAILMHDGVMIYKVFNKADENTMLRSLENYIEKEFEELDMKLGMKFSVKEHCNKISIPSEFIVKEFDEENEKTIAFDLVRSEFEKTHCKITERAEYIVEDYIGNRRKSFKFITENKLSIAYGHMSYEIKKKDKVIKFPFISRWVGYLNGNIRRYSNVGCYPKESDCPDNIYNMWNPFDMEFVDEWAHNQEGLDYMLNHIRVLCNNNDEMYNYFCTWISQAILYPNVKSGKTPIFISNEGSGKGSLIKLFEFMFGKSKILETTTPERDVWGDFNGCMRDCYIVVINELSRKSTIECSGRIKGLITDKKLVLNEKGLAQYTIDSNHRFIITTNADEPINTNHKDRRFFIIRCSDKLQNDPVYFKKFNTLVENVDVQKTCYEYFKSLKGADAFFDIQTPVSEYHNNLKDLGKNKEDLFLEEVICVLDVNEITYTKGVLFGLFVKWIEDNKIDYKHTSHSFICRISNLGYTGISKNKTKTKNLTTFNIPQLRIALGVCQKPVGSLFED